MRDNKCLLINYFYRFRAGDTNVIKVDQIIESDPPEVSYLLINPSSDGP